MIQLLSGTPTRQPLKKGFGKAHQVSMGKDSESCVIVKSE